MNPFEMLVLIVAIVMIANVMRARYYRQTAAPADDLEKIRLQDELRELKERVQVLERIATDGNSSLERQIDELRDRPNA